MPILNDLTLQQFRSLRMEQQLYRIINALNPSGFEPDAKTFDNQPREVQWWYLYRMLIQIPGGFFGAVQQAQQSAAIASIAAGQAQLAAETAIANQEKVGTIKIWPSDVEPDAKWKFVNGDVYLRATYPDLFALVGTRYNTGGELGTEFRVPDLRGRVPAGLGNMGGNNADLLSVQIDGVTLGAKGGFELESYNIGAEYTTGSGGGFGFSSGLYSTIQPSIILAYVIKMLP